MKEADKYLFDLNGFVVVRNVLSSEDVQRQYNPAAEFFIYLFRANKALDRRVSEFRQRTGPLRNTAPQSGLSGDGRTGRCDLGGMLGWSDGDCDVFRSILNHRLLIPFFHELIGTGYRLDHHPLCVISDAGCDGFSLHGGTVDVATGEYNPDLAYQYTHGRMYNRLLTASVQLSDHNPGDGGFVVVPGSHKANFRAPPEFIEGLEHTEYLMQPQTKAGDVVLFSEGTVHGARPWTPLDRQRRIALYRFAPCTSAYSRAYTSPDWPESFTRGMTEAQKAVMLPPYHTRVERPIVADDGASVAIKLRTQIKKDFDRQVFGTDYF